MSHRNEFPVVQFAGPEDSFPLGSIISTMWETTRLSEFMAQNLNRARCVVVPSELIRSWFCDSGVTVPIRVVPLGIDPTIYYPSWPEPSDFFVAHASLRANGGGHRKGFNNLIAAFTDALGDQKDARMVVKVFPDCPILSPRHPRIKLDRTVYTDQGMANFYRLASIGFSMTFSEGWGLTPHEQMACGRPMVAPMHSGMAAYLTEECCYPVAFREQPAHGIHYEGLGNWFPPDHDSAVAALRLAYEDKELRLKKGEAAAKRALEFTWERAGKAMADVIREFRLLPQKTITRTKFRTSTHAIDPDYQENAAKAKNCPHRAGLDPDSCGCSPVFVCAIGKGREVTGRLTSRVSERDCLKCVKTGSVQKVFAFTAYDRPHYLKQMLESLSRCHKVSEYLVLPHVDPGNDEVKSIIKGIDFAETRITWNQRRLGNTKNTLAMWENGFYFSDYCVFSDDDMVFSPDALLFYEWCGEQFRFDPAISSVTPYNRNQKVPPLLEHAYAVESRSWFHGVSFATWRDRYRMVIDRIDEGPTWIWDGAMKREFCELRGMKEVYPILGRADHIGLETCLQNPEIYTPEWYRREVSSVHWAGLEYRAVESFRLKPGRDLVPIL